MTDTREPDDAVQAMLPIYQGLLDELDEATRNTVVAADRASVVAALPWARCRFPGAYTPGR